MMTSFISMSSLTFHTPFHGTPLPSHPPSLCATPFRPLLKVPSFPLRVCVSAIMNTSTCVLRWLKFFLSFLNEIIVRRDVGCANLSCLEWIVYRIRVKMPPSPNSKRRRYLLLWLEMITRKIQHSSGAQLLEALDFWRLPTWPTSSSQILKPSALSEALLAQPFSIAISPSFLVLSSLS